MDTRLSALGVGSAGVLTGAAGRSASQTDSYAPALCNDSNRRSVVSASEILIGSVTWRLLFVPVFDLE